MKKQFITIIIFLFIYVRFMKFSYASWNSDILSISWPNIWISEFITYQLVVILLLGLLYLYNTFIVNKKSLIINKIDKLLEQKKLIISSLRKLKKESENYSKSDFYSNLNSYFRNYFSLLGVNGSNTLSFNDLKKLDLNKDLINLFEKSYLNEFNDKNDIKITRINIIDNLIKLIK